MEINRRKKLDPAGAREIKGRLKGYKREVKGR
jgi:hypothetical protein